MPKTNTAPIRATTQNFVEIDAIEDEIAILKDGSAALVIETTAVNFGLLSEEEQDALIYAYAAFLNSLSFPIQIAIMSKRMDISSYLNEVINEENKQTDPIIKTQLKKYHSFIQSIVKENKVLEKRFYIIVPFNPLELGAKGALIGGNKKSLNFSRDYILSRAKASLLPKKDHVLRQIARIGLKGRILSSQELAELFYNIYNPPSAASLAKLGDIKGYQKPLVESV